MAKYNVTRVVPEGFLHHMAFAEMQDSLAWALSSLGHDVGVTQNWFSESGETNVVFGAELIADFQRLPPGTIIYNLEQPTHPNMAKVRRLAKESKAKVWDYSALAVSEWAKEGHESRHVPIGYTPTLTRIPASPTQDFDVCFFGWMTPRRVTLLEELRKAGLRVFASAACYGGARDNIISRSKVCLNVHHDGRDRFEAVRVSYLMANSKCVVTEDSSDGSEYTDLDRGLLTGSYRVLVDYCIKLCGNELARWSLENVALDLIRKRDFTASVAAALDHPKTPEPHVSTAPTIVYRRAEARREFITEARSIRPRDPRVKQRMREACSSGDMRDFAPWLRDHARGNVMEIGVRDGASTAAFLSGLEEHGGTLYSVDVQPCAGLFEGHPQWKFLQANSTDLQTVIRWMPFEIDLLLIDGDHSRAGVINDFEFARQVRAGGCVLFHDIAPEIKPSGCGDSSWPGDDVKNVYRELCAALEPMGWTHEELPGKYGMGVLRKPPMTAPASIALPEASAAK